MARYKYYTDGKGKVIAVSTFAGKPVRGVSKCNPADTYNEETGREIAKLRCDVKVTKARVRTARQRYNLMADIINKMENKWQKIVKELANAEMDAEKAIRALEDKMKSFNVK